MSKALTEQVIIQYVRKKLGDPIVVVELDDSQIQEMITQTINIYGTAKPIELFESLSVIAGQQKYTIAADKIGRGMIEWFRPDIMRSAASLDEFDVFKYHTFMPNLNPGDYFAERTWWKAVRASAGSEDDMFQYIDPTTGIATVYITPIPSESYNMTYIYVRDPVTLTEVPARDDDWIRDYVLAMSMEVLGRIRGKFRAVQGAEGAIEMDADSLLADGKELKTTLEQYLNDRGAVVPPLRG